MKHATVSQKLILGAAALLLMSSCSLYRSSDRDEFDGNALAGAPAQASQGVAQKGCGDLVTPAEATQIFARPDVELSFAADDSSSRVCRISLKASSESDPRQSFGVDLALCSRVTDPAVLLEEGLDLSTQPEAWRVQVNNFKSSIEFTLARKMADTAAVCRFAFKTQAEFEQNFDLVHTRATGLAEAILRSH